MVGNLIKLLKSPTTCNTQQAEAEPLIPEPNEPVRDVSMHRQGFVWCDLESRRLCSRPWSNLFAGTNAEPFWMLRKLYLVSRNLQDGDSDRTRHLYLRIQACPRLFNFISALLSSSYYREHTREQDGWTVLASPPAAELPPPYTAEDHSTPAAAPVAPAVTLPFEIQTNSNIIGAVEQDGDAASNRGKQKWSIKDFQNPSKLSKPAVSVARLLSMHTILPLPSAWFSYDSRLRVRSRAPPSVNLTSDAPRKWNPKLGRTPCFTGPALRT
ncbi:hypothetical protein C8R44DRAFT_891269 [Mycena epipterygia]|nr:hypothetical protein C8R44DRAFT_891269 [Mycena epipterygia]